MERYFRFLLVGSLVILTVGCNRDGDSDGVERLSYGACSSMIFPCDGEGEAAYCLFGVKFGETNPMNYEGLEATGTPEPGGLVTYAFAQDGERYLSAVTGLNLSSLDPDDISACYATEMRAAFVRWSEVCDISFEEVDDLALAEVQIYFSTSTLITGGIGFPAFADEGCADFATRMIIDVSNSACSDMTNVALHEIGHLIGLGHVGSENIMFPSITGRAELQPGDIAGAQAIYGPR